ncbi:hypothetical protein Exig_2623 [Exiguobacterium sibiricum 255-15]|uniref:Uncharacterized protein n=1 Tax=Exiguobacterium sibiricum (strain DSM 17290 / CCUG 55495 / CIP 109462 / JCM 13490 / 255-15) TaxID=262543 RepID=B1YML1_EXIS2|nr:hypothetical protein [Exiguobacterium sibiricum]ACB62071.1 hypothetical protein Exig_2623 [Exiguobacterium sibiricum 255-15]
MEDYYKKTKEVIANEAGKALMKQSGDDSSEHYIEALKLVSLLTDKFYKHNLSSPKYQNNLSNAVNRLCHNKFKEFLEFYNDQLFTSDQLGRGEDAKYLKEHMTKAIKLVDTL